MFGLDYGVKDVRELVAPGALDDTIEDKDVSVGLGLEDEDVLVERLFDVQDLADLEGHGLAWPLGGNFTEPAVCTRELEVSRATLKRHTCSMKRIW